MFIEIKYVNSPKSCKIKSGKEFHAKEMVDQGCPTKTGFILRILINNLIWFEYCSLIGWSKQNLMIPRF
jgi:hypothetical protein